MKTQYLLLLLILLAYACKPVNSSESKVLQDTLPSIDTLASAATVDTIPISTIDSIDYDTTQWTELIRLDSSILLDIRYATPDNFVGQVMYGCPRCFLRPEAAQAVMAAHQELREEGLGLKMFDCYRPRDVQWKLWEIMPKPGFVADPRKGSIHNRGGAVDLTIVDSNGEELDMGTGFDFFGPEANHNYQDLPNEVLANRRKLKTLLQKHGFAAIRSEWWHYNFQAKQYELSDEEWNCK
jgi:D-alanyl-D-alanine dipeptidase